MTTITQVKDVTAPDDTATRASIERSVASEHPYVHPKDIHAIREADYYVVTLDAAVYRCSVVDIQHVQIVRVQAEDHAVVLEMARRVRIPDVPVPPAPPSPLATVRSVWQQVLEARDPVRSKVNDWANKVSAHRPDVLGDLRSQFQGRSPAPVMGARDVANDDLLRMLGILIVEAASYAREVPALVQADRKLIETAMGAIRTARASLVVATPRRSPLTAGEPKAQILRSEERILEDAETDVGNLREILDELAGDIDDLVAATPRFLVAALRVVREGWASIAELKLEGIRQDLQALRNIPSEREVTAALGTLADAVPALIWDERDLLASPRLRS